MSNQVTRFDDIERVRGFACLMVLIHHIAWISPIRFIHNVMPQYFLSGDTAVFVFFAISGFVVTLSLIGKIENVNGDTFLQRLADAKSMLTTFYRKRFFRIFPVLAVMLIIVAIYMYCQSDTFEWLPLLLRAPIEIIAGSFNYTIKVFEGQHHIYRYALGPMWTLAIESQFYLVWPILLLVCKNNNTRSIMSLVAGCFVLFVMQPTCYAFFGFDYYTTYGTLPSLFLGSFFAFLYKESNENNFNVKLANVITATLLISLWFYSNTIQQTFFSRIVAHIFSVILVVIATFVNGSFNIPILGKIFEYLGSRSYSIYVLQLVLASFVRWYTESIYFPKSDFSEYDFYRIQLAIFFVIMFVTAEIVYRFVEKPFRKIGRR